MTKAREKVSGFLGIEEPVTVSSVPNPAGKPASSKEVPMSKPESYYSIKLHQGFKTPDYALFDEADLVEVKYTFGRYNAEGSKAVRLALLKEVASNFNTGATEGTLIHNMTHTMKLGDLVKDLKSKKIAVLDFAKWVSENLPEKEKSSSDGSGTRNISASVKLAGIINKYFDEMKDGKPDIEARVSALKDMVTVDNLLKAAVFLNKKLDANSFVKEEKVTIKGKDGKPKKINNPAYGQVKLQKQS